ncbi:MAG: bifunctional 5,10-methylenetetrahydrofolate dehydrogenase/5,10-methenyltetrahydrofolate cyclohydrolase [Candidatus Omnitrophica bacterium]|nr:bifunctional 5,10-methylenetetrahydrofolate dehydrogenase/5,10-methenyltetrahydrofolate cyclohydrolase [Candidatus Omnitrophota bacterium]
MSAKLLDGKLLAQNLQAGLKAEVDALRAKTGLAPRFVNIVIGQDAGSGSYGRSQKRVAEAVGIDYRFAQLPHTVTQEELLDQIHFLNNDPAVHGIMIHKPVPSGIDFQLAANLVSPGKDLEGLNDVNLGKLLTGRTRIIPCTPASVMAHLDSTGLDLSGKDAVVVGRSEIVGKPVELLLLERNATVTVCHSGTSKAGRLAEHVKRAEILVVAVGRPGFIRGEWVREGAVVVDVGINEVDGKLVGDVEFAPAAERASFITPVPGGVGPVTAVMLMKNGIEAFRQQTGVGI